MLSVVQVVSAIHNMVLNIFLSLCVDPYCGITVSNVSSESSPDFDHIWDMAFTWKMRNLVTQIPAYMITTVSSSLIVCLQVCLWFPNISAAHICTKWVSSIMDTVWFLAVWTAFTTVLDIATLPLITGKRKWEWQLLNDMHYWSQTLFQHIDHHLHYNLIL